MRSTHSLSLIIRAELPEDLAAIREVNRRAFNQDQEANLVDALRSNGAALLSLVAILDGQVVGHIMYSPATIGTDSRSEPTRVRVSNAAGTGEGVTGEGVTGAEVTGAALAPMAVLPEHQRHGIGSKLIEAGTQKLRDSGHPFIIVLGHPDYYPRFGFIPANTLGITCEWDVPSEAFMILILDQSKTQTLSGLAKYRPEFATVT
jgi:putative acetyltransferase